MKLLNNIVDVNWLHNHLNDPDLVILDASPKSNVSGKAALHEGKVIKGARYFDLAKNFSDPKGTFPNTIPAALSFESAAQLLGINQSSMIVIYDNLGIYTSPRVWWLFKTMGHQNVAILDGGLNAWIAKDFPIETAHQINFQKGNFNAILNANNLRNYNQVLQNSIKPSELLIDARSKGRFDGTAPEPREGLRSGSIPYSINIPFEQVLKDGKLKSEEELKAIFQPAITQNKDIIFSCGSGLTACILLIAANKIGLTNASVYDGSWTEWATLKD